MKGPDLTLEGMNLKHYRSPKTVISRFIARRTVRSAALWAVVFGLYVASKAIGFVDIYPTLAARQKIAETFSTNIGFQLIFGKAPHAATTGALVAWNLLIVMVLIGAIWSILLATRYFRGEEEAGRWELMLSGQTTARGAVINIFTGLAVSLSVFYCILAILFSFVGKSHGVDFNVSSSLFFALSVTLGIAMFMMIGALTSQLLATRSRAASLSIMILGTSFLVKAIADITSARWLLNLTPLGWVEKLQPLYGSQAIWLVPIVGLIILLIAFTIYYAGKRDLGSSIIADKDTVRARVRLLNSPLAAAVRQTRANAISWLVAIFSISAVYGLLTKSAAQAFSQSASAQHTINRIVHQNQVTGSLTFLGIIFFLMMVLIMAYAASGMSAMRKDEAEGYLDNFLVQPVSRLKWLSGRIFLYISVIALAGLLTCLGVWIGTVSQHTGVSFHTLLLASINSLVPVLFTVGAGIFVLGIRPRLTSLIAYAVLVWSFLIEIVSSGINLSHWILDTSILNHIAFAPAANPVWSTNLILVIITILLCVTGAVFFNKRDLQGE